MKQHANHGRDHLPDGMDPIPGLGGGGEFARFGRGTSYTLPSGTDGYVPITGFSTTSAAVFGTGDDIGQNDTSGDVYLYCIERGAYLFNAMITASSSIPAGVVMYLDAIGGYGYGLFTHQIQVGPGGGTYFYYLASSAFVPSDGFLPEKVGIRFSNGTFSSFDIDTVSVNAVFVPASADLASVY